MSARSRDATIVSFVNIEHAFRLKDELWRAGRNCGVVAGSDWLKRPAARPELPLVFYFGDRPAPAAALANVQAKASGHAWRAVVDGPVPPDLPPSLLRSPRFLLWPEDRDAITTWIAHPDGCRGQDGPLAALGLHGASPVFIGVLEQVRRYARCDAPVLIQGETGVGKELVAKAIHRLSSRAEGPFVAVNCGAIQDPLVESELFGHERGAFTGAGQAHAGLASQAERGTLFLDELECLTPKAQVALLRFLQDHTYRPVGGRAERRANLRVIVATNADLSRAAADGWFRLDLFFRLSVLPIAVPPLRERVEDIEVLAQHFVERIAEQYGAAVKSLSARLRAALRAHAWPGNVRELENFMHRAFVLTDDPEIDFGEVGLAEPPKRAAGSPETGPILPLREAKAAAVSAFERRYLRRLMAEADGNVSRAARLAEAERRFLGRMLKRHGWATGAWRATEALSTADLLRRGNS